jgi:ADP-heptose:LPS heptosyltransferase
LKGVWRFGRLIRRTERFDLFISFPDSFSAALMGLASGATHRVGFKKEGREVILTGAFSKPKGLHRAEEYCRLLEAYTGKRLDSPTVLLEHQFVKQDYVVVNINSEAVSRRLTIAKAMELVGELRRCYTGKIVLIGGSKERPFVEDVLHRLPVKEGVDSVAGKTTLPQLAQVLASAKAVLTTDSGPAHLANALGTPTVVLFGAGNENNTSPYNKPAVQVIRLGKLSCEPCVKNECVQFGTPQCLELLESPLIIHHLIQQLTHAT